MPTITRRDAMIAVAALPAQGLARAEDAPLTLASAARAGQRFYGAAVQFDQLREDRALREAVLAECDSLSPELALKWATIQPRPDGIEPGPMDQLAGFARRYGKRIHGHTLLWHRSVPGWAAAAIGQTRNWDIVHRYFEAVMPRYADVIGYWDVVNEPIEPQDAGGLRNSLFLQAFGPDYIRRALDSARFLAPRAKLLINDYGLEYPGDEARRKRLLKLIEDLRRSGTPLDGIGLQAHLQLDRPHISQRILQGFLAELADRGLVVLVTELDVREAGRARSVTERDQRVADAARSFLEVALDHPAVVGLSTWGLSDRYSWLNEAGMRGGAHPGPQSRAAVRCRDAAQAAPIRNDQSFRRGQTRARDIAQIRGERCMPDVRVPRHKRGSLALAAAIATTALSSAAGAEDRGVLFAGTVVNGDNSAYLGAMVPLPGWSFGHGLAVRGVVSRNRYSYDAGPLHVRGRAEGAELAAVYAISGAGGYANLALGGRYISTRLVPPDPGNRNAGRKGDAFVGADGAAYLGALRLSLLASYGVSLREYYSRAELARTVVGTLRLGGEVIAQGNSSYQRQFYGAVLSVAPAEHWDLRLSGGENARHPGHVGYFTLSLSRLF